MKRHGGGTERQGKRQARVQDIVTPVAAAFDIDRVVWTLSSFQWSPLLRLVSRIFRENIPFSATFSPDHVMGSFPVQTTKLACTSIVERRRQLVDGKVRCTVVLHAELPPTVYDGISFLRRLRELKLCEMSIPSLDFLCQLQLKRLYLPDCTLLSEDYSPLQGMPLEELDLSGATLSNLQFLKGMWLECLYLKGCYVHGDLPRALQGMPLTELDLSKVSPKGALPHLRFLEGMPLATLWLDQADVAADTTLNLATLRKLDIYGTDKVKMGNLPQLQALVVGEATSVQEVPPTVSDLSCAYIRYPKISNLPLILKLTLIGAHLPALGFLEGMPLIRELSLPESRWLNMWNMTWPLDANYIPHCTKLDISHTMICVVGTLLKVETMDMQACVNQDVLDAPCLKSLNCSALNLSLPFVAGLRGLFDLSELKVAWCSVGDDEAAVDLSGLLLNYVVVCDTEVIMPDDVCVLRISEEQVEDRAFLESLRADLRVYVHNFDPDDFDDDSGMEDGWRLAPTTTVAELLAALSA